ncbi:hypothetical protein EV1_044832 [Malus domestica]
MLGPLLLRFRGLVIMLTVLYELEPEKYIDWTGHVAVFPACKDCALASFKTKFSATPFVDELDDSENPRVHTASLHTAPCVNLFLKKHERTDGASVLFGVKLRTSTPLVYELELEKSTRCVVVFLARKDCALALLGGELGATPLEEFQESEKSALQTQINIVLSADRMAVIWAPKGCGVDGFFAVALSEDNKVLVLDDPEYVHYNVETINLTNSQDKRFIITKRVCTDIEATTPIIAHFIYFLVCNITCANQHKCPARSQGRKILSSSCNALPIVTNDIAVTKRILWLSIKHGARVSQKDKLGLTFFFVILLLGWIPGVNAADENALLQGCTCTWICIIIVTIPLVYFTYKIYSQPPPEPYLFSEKVKSWTNGEMNVEVYDDDDEGILVGSWRCAFFTANGDAVDITEWVTNLLIFVLHIIVQQDIEFLMYISCLKQLQDQTYIEEETGKKNGGQKVEDNGS